MYFGFKLEWTTLLLDLDIVSTLQITLSILLMVIRHLVESHFWSCWLWIGWSQIRGLTILLRNLAAVYRWAKFCDYLACLILSISCLEDIFAWIIIEEVLLICAAFSSVVCQSAAGRKAPFILVINLQVTWTIDISCHCTTFLCCTEVYSQCSNGDNNNLWLLSKL